jgi:dCTP deaminase
MILSGKEIERQKLEGNIKIVPFNRAQLNPNSYNVKLADELLVYEDYDLDMKKEHAVKRIKIPPEGFVLVPGIVFLARTEEYTETDKFVPMIEGRSSVGRLGMFVHVTAGFGDVGFKGFWTLEIFVIQPLRVYAGTEIAQLYYHTIEGDYDKYESGKYQNQDDIMASKLFKDFEQPQVNLANKLFGKW